MVYLVLLSVWLACSGVVAAGQDGVDFIYYCGNATDYEAVLPGVGARLESWAAKNIFGATVERIMLDVGGEVGGGEEFILSGDAYFVVTKGEAFFGSSIADGLPIELGDLVWIGAGTAFGPIISNSGDEKTVIVSISSSGFQPSFSPSSASNPTTVLDDTIRVWRHADVGFRYKSVNDYPLADRVDWQAGDSLKPHYHPRGSFYIPLDTCQDIVYGGDRPELVRLSAGDVRWVRPGYFYTEERTDGGCLFLALHESQASWVTNTKKEAWVSWERFEGEYQCQYETVETVVFGEQGE